MQNDIHIFLEQYFAQHGLCRNHQNVRYVEFNFTDSNVEQELVKLASGQKTASYRIFAWLAEQRLQPLPVGGILVFADTYGEAVAAGLITKVKTVKYVNITEDMTQRFALGDGSLETWRARSEAYLIKDCADMKIEFNQDTEILVTWFDIIYPMV